MTKDELKAEIKNKYGTISNFSRCSKIKRIYLQKFFARDTRPDPKEFDRLVKAVADTPVKDTLAIDPVKLEALKVKIDKYGGPYKLSKDLGYTTYPVYQIYNGKLKRESKLAKALFRYFGIS